MPRKKKIEVEPSKETVVQDNYIGTISEDIFAEKNREKDEAEKEFEYYKQLKRFEHDGEILWGTVYSVESYNGHAVICLLWNNIKVDIVDEMYFEPEFEFGKSYESLGAEEKLKRRIQKARFQIGAHVCFKVIAVDRGIITEGEHVGEYEISVVGSRCLAMETLRDIYFWHKNRKIDELPPRSIEKNDVIYANVLAVREDSVLLECAGVETRIGAYDVTDQDIVSNCTDYLNPGDRMKVLVKNVYLNESKVHLSVTGRLNVTSKLINTVKVGSPYLGTVIRANYEKGSYRVMLKIGVPAAVPMDLVAGRVRLSVGDKVNVYVTNIYPEFVSGTAFKL